MVVLVDTNVIIDFLATREPFYESSSKVIEKCSKGELEEVWRSIRFQICGAF